MSRVLMAALAALAATPALAQTAAPPAGQTLGGPMIPSLCLMSKETVIATSKVGLAASARLKVVTDQAQAEINADHAPLEAEAQSLQAQQSKLTQPQLQQRAEALQTRLAAVQQKADLRKREVEATREKALNRIAQEAQPVIVQVYKAHNCGLLIDRDSVLGGNMGGDLTAEVIKGLDAKIATITFERESLAQAGAAPAPAAR
jgi:Skp family chaperone for outer membrane proteins